MRKIIIFYILGSLFLLGCSNSQKETSNNGVKYTCPMHPQIVENQEGDCPICKMDLVPSQQILSNTITLDDNQMLLGNIRTQKVSENGFSNSSVLNGRLILNPNNVVAIASKFTGRIEKLFRKEIGISLSKGDALYQIYSEELLNLQKEYIVNFKQQKAFPEEEIYAKLLKGSQNKLILYGYNQSMIKNLALKEQLNPYITVYAQESGVISEINVSEGQYVSEGETVLNLENLNSLWVEADLYANENVKEGTLIQITVSGFENETISSKILEISPQLNENSQILSLRALVENKNLKYQPGMQATINLQSASSSKSQISLPNDAVIRDQNGAHVWVKTGKGEFKQKIVKIGPASMEQIMIKSGINLNDEVVISGAYLLTSEYILKKGGSNMAM